MDPIDKHSTSDYCILVTFITVEVLLVCKICVIMCLILAKFCDLGECYSCSKNKIAIV